ncbi:hypothetical protein K438DRAFT_1970689 [Mycena galopus ATCC 62051]|nr:hypothetical protein K438DRAFT_1970689 [Mycena galopus ATCC 62051]
MFLQHSLALFLSSPSFLPISFFSLLAPFLSFLALPSRTSALTRHSFQRTTRANTRPAHACSRRAGGAVRPALTLARRPHSRPPARIRIRLPHPRSSPLAYTHSPPRCAHKPLADARHLQPRPPPTPHPPTPAARNPSCTHGRRTRRAPPLPTHARPSHFAPTPAARTLLVHATLVYARPSHARPLPAHARPLPVRIPGARTPVTKHSRTRRPRQSPPQAAPGALVAWLAGYPPPTRLVPFNVGSFTSSTSFEYTVLASHLKISTNG